MLTMLMGVGGGFILVPAMIYLLGISTQVVVGTSLFQTLFVTADDDDGPCHHDQGGRYRAGRPAAARDRSPARRSAPLRCRSEAGISRMALAIIVLLVGFRMALGLAGGPTRSTRSSCCEAGLLLLALLAPVADRGAEPRLVPDVSQRDIEIAYSFTGAELLLFGAILYPGGGCPTTTRRHRGGVKGPVQSMLVREKAKVAGIWVNAMPAALPLGAELLRDRDVAAARPDRRSAHRRRSTSSASAICSCRRQAAPAPTSRRASRAGWSI
jgi:hypothetical protein